MGNYTRLVHDLMPTPDSPKIEDFMLFPGDRKGTLIQGDETPNGRRRKAGYAPLGEQLMAALIDGDDEAARELLEYSEAIRNQ